MTDTLAHARDTAAAPLDRPEVAAVADNFVELVRTFNRNRTRLLAAAAHDVEWSAHLLLKCLRADGPMRAGAIAECLHSDPSTVSRQVAALIKDGLLERRADPADGRASLLVLTPKADAVLADHDRIRLEYFADIVADWSDAELKQFARLLHRFTEAYSAGNDAWLAARLARRAVGGNA
jgi:DNA-binding MarR family transcriptional regulator